MRFLEVCHFCVYINANGTCGNNRSIMFGVVTTKPDYPPPNFVVTEGTTTKKPSKGTRGNVKYKAFTITNKNK